MGKKNSKAKINTLSSKNSKISKKANVDKVIKVGKKKVGKQPQKYGGKISFNDSPEHFGFVTKVIVPGTVAPIPKPVPIDENTFTAEEFSSLQEAIEKEELAAFNRFFDPPIKTKLTGKGLIAAVIDTGVSYHYDLKDSIIDRLNCTNTGNTGIDMHGHGTHISGIIAGRNGLATKAKIISLKITEGNSSEASWTNITRALQTVKNYNANKQRKGPKISVVNLSFNGFDNIKPEDEPKMQKHIIYTLIKELHHDDVPVVISGGNYFDYMINFSKEKKINSYGLAYPAICRYAIPVGAVFNKKIFPFAQGDLAPFTQRLDPDGMKHTFLLAPAVDTVSCGIHGPNSYTRMGGSSQAAAIVTGMILLIQEARNMLNVDTIKDLLKSGIEPKPNTEGPAIRGLLTGNLGLLRTYFDRKKYITVNLRKLLQSI